MMIYTLCIHMQNNEGALERILGRLRQRSFSLCSMQAGIGNTERDMVAEITVRSDRSAEYAMKQIDKLYDVDKVQLRAQENEEESKNVFRPMSNTVEASLPL